MGKKTSSGKHYTSKGQVGTDRKLSKAIARDRTPLDRHLAQLKAFAEGKNVVFTVPNPNVTETAKKFIRINAKDIYGDWRKFKSGVIDKGDAPAKRKGAKK